MEEAVTKQDAHPNTVFHCLYGYYNLGYSKQELAHVYNKTDKTIGNWIKVYERTGTFERARTKGDTKFGATHRQWLLEFYQDRPLAYIDEAQSAFKRAHNMDISKTSVWRIIHDGSLTWKVLERRAMHIDILRFMQELSTIDWSHQNIVFLDEASFDNRGMIRKRGYSLKGTTVAVRGDFQRKPRVSVLAFIGVHAVIDYYDTEGTFDRVKVLESCRAFAYSKRGNVRQYPGSNSVWILDGAAIHRHSEIVHFLRSIGVVPIFLPAYCPFFNPIEYLFGYVKKAFQRHYDESSGRDLTPFIVQTFTLFEGYKMANVFEHCGWSVQGYFNPVGQLAKEISTAADARESCRQMDAHQDELEFSIRQN